MSFFFRWTAPLFKLSRHRWSADDFQAIAARLRPFTSPGGRLLDLGGGTGDLGQGVGRLLGAEVIVADITPQMLRRVSPDPSVTVSLTAAEALPFPDDHFDSVLVSDALHHFSDQAEAAKEIARVVRPEGAVLVFEFRRKGMGRALVFLERLLGEPAAFMEPDELRSLLGRCGIEGLIVERGAVGYTFLGRRVRSIP